MSAGIGCRTYWLALGLFAFLGLPHQIDAAEPLRPVVELEVDLYTFQPADNGAGPMWCSGSTTLVRTGAAVFASGLETIADAAPLNNCRWTLFSCPTDTADSPAWKQIHVDLAARTREPSPLATFHDGRVFLSANPTVTEAGVYSGPSRPELLQIHWQQTPLKMTTEQPQWSGSPPFSEHSYRSLAADGARGELILLQNIGYDHAEWSFRDAAGVWSAAGQIAWPWGAEYEKPQPARLCYPNVLLRNRAVHFCGVSDIVEPKSQWRDYKKKLTGRDWDYDFRRLFYTWSDDITTGEFHPWVEIASREETGGWIQPCDLWLDPQQRVHLLWTERAIDERLRSQFFPEARQSMALNYAIVQQGHVQQKTSLIKAEEGGAREVPGAARFQVTPEGRLFVFYYVSGVDTQGRPVSENRVLELRSDGSATPSVTVPLKSPLASFFNATVRAGSPPSDVIDLLGQQPGKSTTISYARVRLE